MGDQLFELMDKFVTREVNSFDVGLQLIRFFLFEVHRLMIVDDNQHIVGILSISDLMRFLISKFESN